MDTRKILGLIAAEIRAQITELAKKIPAYYHFEQSVLGNELWAAGNDIEKLLKIASSAITTIEDTAEHNKIDLTGRIADTRKYLQSVPSLVIEANKVQQQSELTAAINDLNANLGKSIAQLSSEVATISTNLDKLAANQEVKEQAKSSERTSIFSRK